MSVMVGVELGVGVWLGVGVMDGVKVMVGVQVGTAAPNVVTVSWSCPERPPKLLTRM